MQSAEAQRLLKRERWLPKGFEAPDECDELRQLVVKADRLRQAQVGGEAYLSPVCTEEEPCQSGLCPTCVRTARADLLKAFWDENFFNAQWLFVTVFVKGWTLPPGKYQSFRQLRKPREIENLLQVIRRMGKSDVIIIGCVETVWKVVGNEPVGMPFHIHCLIHGLEKQVIEAAIRKAIDLDEKAPQPICIKEVKPSIKDMVRSLSYVFKQPFWKTSQIASADRKKVRQRPKSREMAQLIQAMGAHQVFDRVFSMGVRRYTRRWRRTLN